uniref:Uncharacterized protein n=1 Tax=Triticum urartu TaxID=4572 RepID=A0A8R7V1Y3_TRIUA
DGDCYFPKDDIVVLLTHRRPTCTSVPEQSCAIAIVRGDAVIEGFNVHTLVELLSGSLPLKQHNGRAEKIALSLFAVHLINQKTAMYAPSRLPTTDHRDIKLIEKIAKYAPMVGQECNLLLPKPPPQIPP